MSAIELIAAERRRQVEVEGWTDERDDRVHRHQSLALAAACYAIPAMWREQKLGHSRGFEATVFIRRLLWPWNDGFWKPTPDDRIRELVKAGALIVAEIERLQRASDG